MTDLPAPQGPVVNGAPPHEAMAMSALTALPEPAPPPSSANLGYEAAAAALAMLHKAAALTDSNRTLEINNYVGVAEGYRHLAETLGERGHALAPPRPPQSETRSRIR